MFFLICTSLVVWKACYSNDIVGLFFFITFHLASVNVYVPKDRVTNLHQGYGFVEFRSEEDADYVSDVAKPLSTSGFDILKFIKHWDHCIDYDILFLLFFLLQAIKILNMIKLYGKPIRVNKVCLIYSSYAYHLCIIQIS